jgi:hypothetical protein
MKNMIGRIDEHIEHHDMIDSHKSDAGFLREVKQYILNMEVKIDNLMLEYCPEDMTKEQIKNWQRHQEISKLLP